MKTSGIEFKEIRRTRKLFQRISEEERTNPRYWTVYDSGLQILNKDFISVLNADNIAEALERWHNVNGAPVGMVELGGTGHRLADELRQTKLPIGGTLSVSMTDPRNLRDKVEDVIRHHEILTGNCWSASMPRKIVQTLGRKPNLIIAHMTGGLTTAPMDLNYITAMMERYLDILDHKGLFLGQVSSGQLKGTLEPLNKRLRSFGDHRKNDIILRSNITEQHGSRGKYLILYLQKLS